MTETLDAAITLTGTEAYAEAAGALLARGRQRHDIMNSQPAIWLAARP